MPHTRTPLEPAAAYEHANLIARDLLTELHRQLDESLRPDDCNLRWRHVHAMNRLNATLTEACEAVDRNHNRKEQEETDANKSQSGGSYSPGFDGR